MNDQIWQAEDGRLLKDLRTAAGWDIHEFSRAASISLAQLRQLEEGGNELFYSQTIKFQMGRKLLRKLGADVVRVAEEPVPETPSLFDFSPSPAKAPSLEETLSAAPSPVLHQPEATAKNSSPSWVPVLAGLGVLLVAGVFGSQLRSPSPGQQSKADAAPVPTVAVAPAASAATAPVSTTLVNPSTPASPPNTEPAVPAVTPPPVAVAPMPAPTNNPSACQWDSGAGNSFMPRGMEKPSTYVHFVANADASLCVQDRKQKVTQVNLKAGEKLTVRGTAPWRIQSTQWADVAVYFQGYRMPVPASASLVTLNPRLEPLAEVAAPASN